MTGYAFLDCGDGRRLENLGGVRVVRPAPAADFPPSLPAAEWRDADLEFSRESGWRGEPPADWRVTISGVVMGLRTASQGQIGVFPEHAAVTERVAAIIRKLGGEGNADFRVLNLFAHTGMATLALAGLGVGEVVHVDAAGAAVRAARDNAVLSGLADARVRWLVEDAGLFVGRENRRGRFYDVVMADPPSYGRSGKRDWRLGRDLPGLARGVGRLLGGKGCLFCLTCHSEGWNGKTLAETVGDCLPGEWEVRWERLALRAGDGGNDLPSGFAVYAVKGKK